RPRRAARAAVLGGDDPPLRHPRLRHALGRAPRGRHRPRGRGMKIAVLAPVSFAVPPSGYGGIEWIVSLLADGLVDAGHDVTLFASGDSHTKAHLSFVFEQAPSEQIGKTMPDLRHALACFDQAGEFDVVNDHSGQLAVALGGLVETPVLHTV